jgi:hypothetical protein
MKNKIKNLALSLMVAGLSFTPVITQAQVIDDSENKETTIENPTENPENQEENEETKVQTIFEGVYQKASQWFQTISLVLKSTKDTQSSTIRNLR